MNVIVLRNNREVSLRAVLSRSSSGQMTWGYMMNRMSGRMSQRRAGFPQAIQHDTVLEPEMCGGPVVDLSGCAGMTWRGPAGSKPTPLPPTW